MNMKEYEERLKGLEGQLSKLEKDLLKINGALKLYVGKQLVLNDNLDVLQLKRLIEDKK